MSKGYVKLTLTDEGVGASASIECSIFERLALLNAFLSAIHMDDEEALVALKILPVIRSGLQRESRKFDTPEELEKALKKEAEE